MTTIACRGDILGFLVQELPDDISTSDILQQERILYPTWDAAIIASSLLANRLSDKYNSKVTCILRSSSRNACIESGYAISHRLHDWRCDVIIYPVFAALKN
jgi:hypothetical protein